MSRTLHIRILQLAFAKLRINAKHKWIVNFLILGVIVLPTYGHRRRHGPRLRYRHKIAEEKPKDAVTYASDGKPKQDLFYAQVGLGKSSSRIASMKSCRM
jgi:hypothetical protein